MKMLRVHVHPFGPCIACPTCLSKHHRLVADVGMPPFHRGCTCYAIEREPAGLAEAAEDLNHACRELGRGISREAIHTMRRVKYAMLRR